MGFTPFSLIYGREARLPMDLEHAVSADLIISDGDSSLPHAERMKKYLQRAYCILRQRIPVVKRKKRYDEGRRDLLFKELELYLVRIRWLGPYVRRIKPFREKNHDKFATDTDSEEYENPLTTMSKRGSSENDDLNGGTGVLTLF